MNIIYGRHPVTDALKAGKSFDKVLFQQGITGELEKEIRLLCRDYEVPLQIVPKERLSKFVSGGVHQGVIGFLSEITYYHLDDVLPMIYEKGETPLIVMLDGVTDVRNFGAIARSAEALGAHAIVVPRKGAALINADAMKASAGALNYIPVCRETSIQVAMEYLQTNGIQVVAADLSGKCYPSELNLAVPMAIIMGAEGEPVSPHLLKRADAVTKLYMLGNTNSLNVSVAAGMLLYEITRQRVAEGI